jgi:hypothetical protein
MIRFGLSRGAFGWAVWLLIIGLMTLAGYALGIILGPWDGGPAGGTTLGGALLGAWLGSYIAVPLDPDPDGLRWDQMTAPQRAAFVAEVEKRLATDQEPAGATREPGGFSVGTERRAPVPGRLAHSERLAADRSAKPS